MHFSAISTLLFLLAGLGVAADNRPSQTDNGTKRLSIDELKGKLSEDETRQFHDLVKWRRNAIAKILANTEKPEEQRAAAIDTITAEYLAKKASLQRRLALERQQRASAGRKP